MPHYLGETIVEQKNTKYSSFTQSDWAMYFLERYGGFDGAHHKDWVLDQIARCMKDTPIIIKLAKWSDGTQEYRIETGEPSEKYLNWVKEMKAGEDGENTYDYDEGIAP